MGLRQFDLMNVRSTRTYAVLVYREFITDAELIEICQVVPSMTSIKIYTKNYCGFCFAAKNLLTKHGLDYEEIEVTHDAGKEKEMRELSGRRTVPQIFIDGKSIGGYDELLEMDRQGQLESVP